MDVQKLRNIVSEFRYSAKPSNGNYSDPCTVGDLNKVISKLSNALEAIIDEIELEQVQ